MIFRRKFGKFSALLLAGLLAAAAGVPLRTWAEEEEMVIDDSSADSQAASSAPGAAEESSLLQDTGSEGTSAAGSFARSGEAASSGSTSSSGGSLFEDENTNIQYRDGISAEESGKKQSSRKMIIGYAQTGLIQSISYDEGNKPSLSALLQQFPSTVSVYLEGEKKPVTLKTTWKCEGQDYNSAESGYYLFSPSFDEKTYAVRVTPDAPYIEVKKNPSVAVEMIASAPPTVNEKKILEYCVQELGLNRAAVCGILANLCCESDFRTNAVGDGGTSVGICQWHLGRFTGLKSHSDKWQTLDGQLDYMKWELQHGYSAVYDYLKNVSDNEQGAYDAAYFWCRHYEMPDSAHTRGITRALLAKNIYWPRYGEDPDTDDEEGCNRSFAGTYVFSGEGSLNIREGHSKDSAVTGSVPEGAEVEVTKANGEWAHILYEGKSGLCSMEYLTAEKSDEEGQTEQDRDGDAEDSSGDREETEAESETESETKS